MSRIGNQINQILRNSGMSVQNQELVDSFRGINIQGRNANVPLNRENHGFTFFTRPALNLSDDNILPSRVLSSLMTTNMNSTPAAVRALLDYQLSIRQNYHCPIIDQYSPFIPFLTNNLTSLTGWRDYTNLTSSTAPGIYRETIEMVDDTPFDYEAYDITANFRNIKDDPISFLFYIWCVYAASVKVGDLMPYPEFAMLREIDYNTRIWRLVTDVSRQRVTRIIHTGASFPTNSPIGNIMNFSNDGSETPFTTIEDQISINFRSMGTRYHDYLSVLEFNWLVKQFNRYMRDDLRTGNMHKLDPVEIHFFNRGHLTYPLINDDMGLEWWVSKSTYEAFVAAVLNDTDRGSTLSEARDTVANLIR